MPAWVHALLALGWAVSAVVLLVVREASAAFLGLALLLAQGGYAVLIYRAAVRSGNPGWTGTRKGQLG